jgi:uncharacterized protein (TIGR03437 family)
MRLVLFFISTLVIAADFTTSLGDMYPYTISAITTDSAGNTYVVGSRQFGSFGFAGVFSIINGAAPPVVFSTPGGSDVFVSKLDPNGQLLFTDTFAGKGVDQGNAIALDPSGNIYIAGSTTSPDFPLSKALQTQPNTSGTGFIVKLSNDGSTILYSTYFGGLLGGTSISSLATDSKGNLFLTGWTNAPDFPHTPGLPFGPFPTPQPPSPKGTAPVQGAIIASISAAGDKILYAGAILGSTSGIESPGVFGTIGTSGAAIAVDPAGNAYIAGNSTLNLPTTPGVLSPNGIGAFVAKVNAAGTGLSYLTYLSAGENIDIMEPIATVANTLYAIAVDAAGNAYLGGATSDPKFPTTPGTLKPGFNVPPGITAGPTPIIYEGFLAKLKPDASGMAWATFLDRGNAQGGGTFVQSIAADPSGNVWASGITGSNVFPSATGVASGPDFVVGLNALGSALTYQQSSPLGTVGQSVALDPSGLVHVAGMNGFVSAIAPTAPPSMKISDFQNAAGGNVTARISPAEVIAIFGQGIGPATPVTATPTGGFYPTTLAGVQVTINGVDMPLLYVSSGQINAVVPMKVAPNSAAAVRVINGTAVSPAYPVWIVASAPQAFPPVLNQDGSVNTPTNPAKSGSTVTIFATGWQSTFFGLADGQVATAQQDTCLGACQITTLNAQSPSNFTVLYGGPAPGFVAGVTQFNVHLGTTGSQSEIGINLEIFGPATITQTVWMKP